MGTIELRGFAKLYHVFKEKGLGFPEYYEVNDGITGKQLIQDLGLGPEDVEAIMVNGCVFNMKNLIKPGDRVAILPPGTPGPYRVILGIINQEKE